eukprot:Phypoly_transcript_04030.p1 GENE.Phypoly_transcript_04030~~Phypoly_transcript_04030.p1  ORF type:complete len:625 (+),score=47.65 Phypoly_transcript_04030:223-2097(+)
MHRTGQAYHQEYLSSVVRTIFPNQEILVNTRKSASILNATSGKYVELDIFVPNLRLCFEFQDVYHYSTTWYSQAPLSIIQHVDNQKREMVLRKGDSLITVPCWWNGDISGLRGTIAFNRPDIHIMYSLLLGDECIPLNPNFSYFNSPAFKPQDLMLASFPVHFVLNLHFWWMGEKYDGIRCYWDSSHKKLYTRNGMILNFPQAFMKLFHTTHLDSEIWFGRGNYVEAQGVFQDTYQVTSNWSMLRVIGFDDPSITSRSLAFEIRFRKLLDIYACFHHPIVIIPSRVLVQNRLHFTHGLQHILQNAGEGLILQQFKSLYEPGRSEVLYKFKAAKGDQEGLVVGITSTSVQLQLPNETLVEVSQENSDVCGLKTGDVVTFEYNHFSRTLIPVCPKIVRVRRDLFWEDVLSDFEAAKKEQQQGFAPKPKGYWHKNLRAMLEQFAKKCLFDPLVPANWYSVRYKSVLEFKEFTQAALAHYNGSFVKCLLDVFPDIGLNEHLFLYLQKGYWHNVGNRINLFNSFANQNNFDPLLPHNWYGVSAEDIRSFKGFKSMLRYYEGSVVQALVHLFPNIGLHIDGFPSKLLGSFSKEIVFEKSPTQSDDQVPALAGHFIRSQSRVLHDLLPNIY